jgi:hypothetical protein
MSLLIVLPRETAILSRRRAIDVEKNQPIMHAIDSDVFCYLCGKTDWASGQIGVQSKISYSRIALALTEDIPRKPNRTLRLVKRKCVYNSVQRLIKAGLLHSESVSELDKNALILRRVFWQGLLKPNHYKNNVDSQQLSGFFSEMLKNKHLNNSGLPTNEKSATADRYCADGIYKKPINITNANSNKFQLSLTWHYDEKLVELFLKAAGFSSKQIKQVWFGKYVQYWSDEAIMRTQREWSRHFANHMQSYLLRPDYFEQVNGMLEENSTAVRSPSMRKTMTVPRLSDGAQLQVWAIAKGLPTAPVGFSTPQYYQLLCNTVERIRIVKERKEEKIH